MFAPQIRTTALLGLGAAAGLALALHSAVERAATPMAPGFVATVNDRPIERVALDQALISLSKDRKRPPDADERARVLERLIDEELLVQRALELELERTVPAARAALVDAVMSLITLEAASRPMTDRDLARHFENNSERFAPPPVFAIDRMLFADGPATSSAPAPTPERPPAMARARAAHAALEQGRPWPEIADELSDPPIVTMPAELQPARTWAELIGPSALAAARKLPRHGHSAVLPASGGFQIIRVTNVQTLRVGGHAENRDAVKASLERDRADAAVREQLARLRGRAHIEYAE